MSGTRSINMPLRTLALSLCVAGLLGAATGIKAIEATSTQAVIRVVTSQAGACTYRVAQDQNFTQLVHDVDTGLFAGSNLDSRPGSIVNGSKRAFVAGRRTSDVAIDGRRYSRALQANTTYFAGVKCGSDLEAVQTFHTTNPPMGQTYPESAPFNTAGFGNYAWPSIDFGDQSKSYVDPMTGIGLKRITSPGWANSKNYQNIQFGATVSPHGTWGNTAAAPSWPPSAANLATYTGAAGVPLFLAVDLSMVPDYIYGGLTISGWVPQMVMDDLLVRTYGNGTDPAPANRTVLVCLSLDSGNTCNTPQVPIVLPAGGAQTGPTAPASGYPKPAWTSWSNTPPFSGRDFGNVLTTVTTTGHTITNTGNQSSQYFSRGWKPGAKVMVNGTEIYTIASVVNSSTITTLEALIAHPTAVAFKSLAAGVRVTKQTGTGSVSMSLGYDFAVSGDFAMPLTGVRNLCSSLTVNVTVDANGNPAPSRAARICALQSGYTHSLFAFFTDNGESRLLSNFSSTVGFQYRAPDWQQYDGLYPDRTHYTSGNVWDQDNPTRFYSYMQFSGGHYGLVQIDYTGNFSAYQPFPETNGYYTTGYWPDDKLVYSVIGGYPSDGQGVDQQVAAAGNPYFDATKWKVWSLGGILPGGKAVWAATTTCCGESPVFFAIQDVTTGKVTQVLDTISKYPMRFWGNHSTQILDGYSTAIANIPGNKGTNVANYLGGPFMLYPTQVQQGGQWSSNTALTATYADTCPTTIDPRWQSLGATGLNCVLIRAKQPCSDFASSEEAAKFPCPWDASKSMVSSVAPGDRFWIGFPVAPSGESMRVVTAPVDLGGGVAEFWVLRHSENYNNLGGNYGGTGDTHPNGWSAGMIPPEARTNAIVEIGPDGTVLAESYSVSATHTAIGPGLTSANATAVVQGADPVTGAPLYNHYGIRWNTPIPVQAGKNPDYNLYSNGRFGGLDLGGGAMESYISMQQTRAPSNEKRWFLDLHHLNPSSGTGQEAYAGIGGINAAAVAGTGNVSKFTSYPGTNTDMKHFPAMAFAGPYLLRDMSGPGSQITDTTSWSYCFAYKAGECVSGSGKGEIYTSVPQNDTHGFGDRQCIAGWYAQLNPCGLIPFSSAGWAMQVDASRLPTDESYWRKLTQGFSGMGRQYQFGNTTATPDGTWAFIQCYWCDGVRNEILGVQMPPMPPPDSVNHADFYPLTVQVPASAEPLARVKFGYAENGAVTSFFCSSRQEACVTDATVKPFAYAQSDTPTAVNCSTGCTIPVPAISGRVLYYQLERLDGGGNVVSVSPMSTAAIP